MEDAPAEPPSSGSGWRWQDAPGSFQNGVWYCSCNPPLKAAFRMTIKEGRNKGKWFYTCEKPPNKQCGFFLWESAAIGLQRRAAAGVNLATTTPTRPARDSRPGAVQPATATPGRVNPTTPTLGRFNPPTVSPGGFTPGPSGINQGLREHYRSETPQSEVGSTMTGDLLFSPTSTTFPMPGRNRLLFGTRSASREPIFSSIEDGDGEGTYRPSVGQEGATLTTPVATKRKRPGADQGGGGSTDFSEVDSDDEREMLDLTERVESASQEQQARPSQEQLGAPVGDSPITPSVGRGARVRRPGLLSLSTPSSRGGIFGRNPETRTGFTGASETRNSFTSASEIRNSFAGASGSGANKRFKTTQGVAVPTTAVTPTPTRTRDAGDNNNSNPSSSQKSDNTPTTTTTAPDAAITTEILEVLAKQPLSAAAREEVRSQLNLYALKGEGVLRGRDIARVGLTERNARIAELREQVARLEREKQARMELLQRAASEWETMPPPEEGGE
ncbi:hypothetical protein C8A05DRAFT_30996 [Staphylotrichum tortipilum]|uniref:GRF-type domain-containing protein n=1 Tax=Staphylotrichum tortipilum TaxID=2831512 RepID=A0AAN6MRM6_9PEZI|nr:hypothetical protein C8A05DRAFT_30996 [Staphylotrichum longicolle]